MNPADLLIPEVWTEEARRYLIQDLVIADVIEAKYRTEYATRVGRMRYWRWRGKRGYERRTPTKVSP